ncbi:MAG: COX15/CtaA family protein [Gammaproteobacteria bacterium]|jgi:cytochrome c oxidase assembly protein subunit 15
MDTNTSAREHAHNRVIAAWLLVCCALVFAMVVLGGVTRLTGSGLSMVEWDPIFGIIPPLTQEEWLRVFELYRQSPEYQKINIGMNLEGFQYIYWFEFAHRLLGRSIGMAFLLPFLVFLALGWISRPLVPKLVVMFVLGGLQGLLGWYMVKSGLVDNPHVSQYRLTAHLGLAVIIYAYMFHVALGLWHARRPRESTPAGLRHWMLALCVLVFITVLSGGFVAGLKAGHAYNTFPLMNGQWIPETIFAQQPLWRNFFENSATVQFDHRVLATLVFTGILVLWLVAGRHKLPGQVHVGMQVLMAAAVLQVTLGISTLLLHVPVALAATHQGGALLLFTVALYVNQRMAHTPGQGIES